MAQFRKKSVVIEAAKFDGKCVGMWDATSQSVVPGTCPSWLQSVCQEVESFAGVDVRPGELKACGETLLIGTLEGNMVASPGDWIIQGVKGEIYPCKPDIFELSYEPA